VDVIMEGSTIKGVITESKSGRQAILAKRVIDATGDADLACRAGAPYRIDPKHELEGVSVNFGCSGVDVQRFLDYTLGNPSSIADWGDRSGAKEEAEFSTYLVEPFDKAKQAGSRWLGISRTSASRATGAASRTPARSRASTRSTCPASTPRTCGI
jgi:hypothetical protein